MRLRLSSVVVLMLLGTAAAPASAQNSRSRNRALFGGGVGDVDQSLSVSGLAGVSFINLPNGTQPFVDRSLPENSWTGVTSGQAEYALDLSYLQFSANAGALGRYFKQDESQWVSQALYGANISSGRSWRLSPRTTTSLRGNAAVRPQYWGITAGGVPGGPGMDIDPTLLLPPDASTLQGGTVESTAVASITQALTRRLSLTGDYEFNQSRTFARADGFDYLAHGARGRLEVALTRHLSVFGGYQFTEARNARSGEDARWIRSQSVIAGADYNRGGTLRLTRTTSLTFDGGANAVTDTLGGQHYFLVGQTRLLQQLGRTWETSIGASRNLNFSSLFQEPILEDTVSADLGGLITNRLSFRALAAYARGTAGFSGPDRGIERINGVVSLQTALSRYLAISATYAYYDRTIGSGVVTVVGLSRTSRSQVASITASTWLPIFHRARRPHATR
jgi:hypothetical protein